MRFGLILLVILIVVTACQPPAANPEILPTYVPTLIVPVDLEMAERTAQLFLKAWSQSDFDTMHQLISFASQEATPLEVFRNLYETAHTTMTFEKLEIKPNALQRQGERVVLFNYDVTITTRLAGTFSDVNRNLMLVIDPQLRDWRVAWSVADIFPEMGNGAVLRFEPRVPSRANIYDRNGQVLADQNGVAVMVSVIKGEVPNQTLCIQTLADTIGKPIEVLQSQFDVAGVDWTIDAGLIEPIRYTQAKDRLEQVCSASFRQQATRRYLRGSLMPHILGHVGYPDEAEVPLLEAEGFDAETIVGKSGIEKTWDNVLRGQTGGRLQLVGANGQVLRVLSEVASRPAQSLWLTIDADLQEFVLRALGEAYANAADSWARTSKGGSAIILDVNTGEILAMASWPTYEGNALMPFPAIGKDIANDILKRLADDPALPQLNRATQGVYPSGSVMKVVDAVAVLDTNIYNPDSKYVCTGRWQKDNDLRFDWWPSGHGTMTVSSAITNSCNPFFYEVGYQLNAVDPYILPNYARRMGLGVPTGMTDLPEAIGTIPDPDWVRVNKGLTWNFSFAVSMAIGQGEVEVTPLQMVRMYAAIANGGRLYKPQIVRETGILDQRNMVANPQVVGVLDVRPDVLAVVREGMCNVITTQRGTASHIFRNSELLNIGVCGKTGTAQAPGEGVPPHSWFIAYAPAENPQIAIVVMIENAGDGSAIAAPITRRILEYYYFGKEN